jgi:hypothetical protein
MRMGSKKEALASGFALPTPRRTTVDESTSERFVAGQVPERKTSRRPRGERIVFYIPPEVAEEVRVRCARARMSLSEAGAEALAMWIRAGGNK